MRFKMDPQNAVARERAVEETAPSLGTGGPVMRRVSTRGIALFWWAQ